MALVTIYYGAFLTVLGVVGFIASGLKAPTALIPLAFGLLILYLGVLAYRDIMRKAAMHAAAILSLLAVLGNLAALADLPALLNGVAVLRPLAVVLRSCMALASLVYLGLSIKSFVDARRKRPPQPGAGQFST